MKSAAISNKTIRPGTYGNYYYRPFQSSSNSRTKSKGLKLSFVPKALALIVLVLLVITGFSIFKSTPASKASADHSAVNTPVSNTSKTPTSTSNTPKTTNTAPAAVATTTTTAVNHCASNTLSQLILVSISARHLWACNGSTTVYESPVVTGISYLAADVTPTGTFHIYAKYTDQHLIGHDSTGSWDDFVYYWMPFYNNRYGTYGLHDATWRAADAFGNISPDSADASHGCVELPLATAKWLYNWDEVGTTVSIQN